MAWIKRDEHAKENKQSQFFEMLNRGTNDVEVEHELPMWGASQKISELRTVKRNARV